MQVPNDPNLAIKQELARRELARRSLLEYTKYTMPEFDPTSFHQVYYKVLDLFIQKKIKKLMVTVPPQHGKQNADSTPIFTPNGWTLHGSLKVGDYVYGRYGELVQVQWVSEKSMASVAVHFTDGEIIKCHPNHEWVVYDRSKHRDIKVETKYLMSQKVFSDKRCRFSVDCNTHIKNLSEKRLLLEPYFLGIWLGDGSTTKPAITHDKKDYPIIDKIMSYGYERSSVQIHKTTGVYTTCFYGNTYRRFKALGFGNPHGEEKHIPEIYKIGSLKQRLELLAGLIDSDGYVYQKNGRITFSNTNYRLIQDVKDLCISLGFRTTISRAEAFTTSGGIVGKKDVYQLTFNPDLEIPTALPRKKITSMIKAKRRRGITKIVHCEKEPGHCIQVEGGIYLTGKHMVPTHNSEGSSRRLPSYVLGKTPNTKIAICSYGASLAQSFNRDNQRIIDDPLYSTLFPKTYLNKSNVVSVTDQSLRNSTKFEIVGHKGFLKAVGRGGQLTGDPLDMAIMDDLYKDAMEGNSPIIRQAVIDWYTSVVMKRLHNDSQQLIVFTRWHDEDLIGWLEKNDTVITLDNWDQLKEIDPNAWYKINFPALMNHAPTEFDPRELGEALYPAKHSKEKMENERKIDPVKFESMNQGDPSPKEGLLYSNGLKTYDRRPNHFKKILNYTDVADEGKDFLCSINAGVGLDDHLYILDVYYTQEPQEVTEPGVSSFLKRSQIREAYFEGNNGGRGFAREVDKLCKHKIVINTFHQGGNKESRVISNAAEVGRKVLVPTTWRSIWPAWSKDILHFRRVFKANKHDDAADCITGLLEYSGVSDALSTALYKW